MEIDGEREGGLHRMGYRSRSKQGGVSVDEANGGDSNGVGKGRAIGRVAIVEEER